MLDCRPRSFRNGSTAESRPLRDGASNRAGRRRVGEVAQCRGAGLQCRLPVHQLIEFLLELLLIEQLAAGGAIDLSTQFGDAVLIAELLLRLARD